MTTRYDLCGCLRVDTEEEARALRKIMVALGGRGFTIKRETINDDGSVTTAAVPDE